MRTELGDLLAALRKNPGKDEAFSLSMHLQVWTDDELEVLGYVASRIDLGRARYGPLDLRGDERDWQTERVEELVDATIYTGALEVARWLRWGRGAGGSAEMREPLPFRVRGAE